MRMGTARASGTRQTGSRCGPAHAMLWGGTLAPPRAPCPLARMHRPAPQVYYLPRKPVWLQSTLPTLFGSMRIFRTILLRERITLVHAHQAFSMMGLEAILHARTMGYKARQGRQHAAQRPSVTRVTCKRRCGSPRSKGHARARAAVPPARRWCSPTTRSSALPT